MTHASRVKDPELTVLNFRGQLRCRRGEREGPIEAWNLNLMARNTREVMRVPAWTKNFEFMKKELETILERDVLPAVIPEFLTARRISLGLNSPMVVPSIHGREAVEGHEKASTFVGISLHTCVGLSRQQWLTIFHQSLKRRQVFMRPEYQRQVSIDFEGLHISAEHVWRAHVEQVPKGIPDTRPV